MDNVNYIAFICIMVALGMMLPLIERKTREVIIFMIVGICCCMFISEVNYHLLDMSGRDMIYITTTITPLTEEIVKALPILYFAVMVSDDQRRLTADAFAVGVGFALLENMIILMQSIYDATVLWALVRSFGSGMMHGICTVMVGYGISYVRKKRKLFWPGTFALLSVAITYHGVYNVLVQSQFRMAGILLPIITYLPIILFIRKSIADKKKNQNKIVT